MKKTNNNLQSLSSARGKAFLCLYHSLSFANFVGGACSDENRDPGVLTVYAQYACGASSLPPRYPLKSNGIIERS